MTAGAGKNAGASDSAHLALLEPGNQTQQTTPMSALAINLCTQAMGDSASLDTAANPTPLNALRIIDVPESKERVSHVASLSQGEVGNTRNDW